MRRAPLLLLLTMLSAGLSTGLLAGCGELPRPFQHEGDEQPLASPRAAQPITIVALAEMPGLSQALVGAFDKEDIVATTVDGGDNFLRMQGQMEPRLNGRNIHWRVTNSNGELVAEVNQPLDRAAPDAAKLQQIAEQVAGSVGRLLRGDDLGASDLAARPRVAIDQVTVSGNLDADLLKRSLVSALEQQGIAVVGENPQMRVTGSVRITQGLAGHDLVEITWVVNDDKGVEYGKVNQGSPVMRDDLLSKALQMTHQIAAGGAEGIKQLVLKKLKS